MALIGMAAWGVLYLLPTRISGGQGFDESAKEQEPDAEPWSLLRLDGRQTVT